MRELKLHKNKSIVWASVLAVCFFGYATHLHAQTTTPDLEDLEIIHTLGSAQDRFDDAQRQFDGITYVAAAEADRFSQSVFSTDNPGLWLLYALLLGLLLLLVSMRRTIAGNVFPESSHTAVLGPQSEKLLEKKGFDKPLVQPVKVVKIKVRKLQKHTKR